MNRWLSPKRLSTLRWITAGSVFFATIAGASYFLWPHPQMPSTPIDRVVAGVLLLRWPALVLLLMVMSLFRVFYPEDALDPLAGSDPERHRIGQRVLSNSVEHMVFFAPALVALAAAIHSPDAWRIVPIAVALFTVGRVLFWIGYHASPNARAFGFNLSFSTSLATVVLSFVLA